MPIEPAGTQDPSQPPRFTIYINPEYSIQVDGEGYCLSTVYEGALGMVIETRDHTQSSLALKIPKLVADTHRENGHIARLMEKERDTVLFATSKGAGTNGLLAAQRAIQGVLEHQIRFNSIQDEEQQKQNDGFVLVQFSKGKAPRFINVRRVGKEIEIYPPRPASDSSESFNKLAGFFLQHDFWDICSDLTRHRNKLRIAHIITLEATGNESNITPLDQKISGDTGEPPWYAFLPSLLFEWCDSSFQQDIQEICGQPGWNLGQQLEFCQRILRGIRFLHTINGKAGLLHGDVRPANILYHKSSRPKEPEDYSLIDYGSLDLSGIIPSNGHADASFTIPGPTVIPTRYSVFYSEERGQAEEKEFGEVVFWKGNSRFNIVMVGWRNLTAEELEPWFDKFKREMDEPALPAGTESESENRKVGETPAPAQWPAKGDRVRIRDYVFVIRKGVPITLPSSGLVQVFLCEPIYFKVVHNSLSVRVEDLKEWPTRSSEPLRRMSISRITQMMQVGPAADLYSFGVLVLYILYWRGQHHLRNQAVREDRQIIENEFKEVVLVMASKSWMNQIWRGLDAMCYNLTKQLPTLIEKRLDPTEVDWEFRRKDEPQLKLGKYEWKSVADDIKSTVELILINIPGTKGIYESLENRPPPAPSISGKIDEPRPNDSITFLFLIHYAMCCLHRRDHMPRGEQNSFVAPFCLNRLHDEPKNWGGSGRAMTRLAEILAYIRLQKLPDPRFEAQPAAKPPEPIYEIVRRLAKETADHQDTQAKLDWERKDKQDISHQLREQSAACDLTKAELAKTQGHVRQLDVSLRQAGIERESALNDREKMAHRIEKLARAGEKMTFEKHLLSKRKRVLVGDTPENVEAYVSELKNLGKR